VVTFCSKTHPPLKKTWFSIFFLLLKLAQNSKNSTHHLAYFATFDGWSSIDCTSLKRSEVFPFKKLSFFNL
jgi:hypothetical protein